MLSSRSCWLTLSLPALTARSAASLIMLASSAPDAPGQALAISSKRILPAILTLAACTLSISTLPCISGSSTGTRLSKRPGRSSAGSSVSGWLVAASTMMPLVPSKPSISVSSWLRVCSLSSLPPKPLPPLFLPIASISSMKMIQGAFFSASLKRSLTLAAPIPTNISTNSEPEMLKKGTLASPATALASMVLPVPGGPTSKAPLGILAPISLYFFGSCRKSTISASSSLASSSPATSLNLMPILLFS